MGSHLRANSKSLVVLLLLGSLGCNKGYQLAPVSGRVEVDHRPLTHATVSFVPKAGQNLPSSIGLTDEQGKFTLMVNDASKAPGAVIGEHTVSIRLDARSLDKKDAIKHRMQLELLPTRYNNESTLQFTVPAGGTDKADFLDLKSR